MNFNVGTLMDIALLVMLAATVFLAFRLTLGLRHFRQKSGQMERLMLLLQTELAKAEEMIGRLQATARLSNGEFSKIANESKFLSDELRFMNEAGNNLAERLEKLAERNNSASVVAKDVTPESQVPKSGFSIADRDYAAEWSQEDSGNDNVFAGFGEDGVVLTEARGLKSQAERELYAALQTHKLRQRGGTQ